MGPAATSEPDTNELVRRAQQGDREARELLFARLYPDLVQAARFRLGAQLRTRVDTSDLAQTAFLDAVKDLPRFEQGARGSFRGWLYKILENKIRRRLKYFRAKRRDMSRETPLGTDKIQAAATGRSPARRLIDAEERERLEQAIGSLSTRHREVIVLRYYLKLPWAEVAETLRISEEAAQMRCRRALDRLREVLGDEA